MTGLFSKSFRSFDQPIFENYEVLSELGSGGHSTVYLVRDKSGKEVAIKRWLNPDLDSQSRERLEREVAVLRELEHPHIVAFIELCKDQAGRPGIVMDYVPGRTLHAHLESGPFPQERALELALTLAETLSFLASKGLVHRDVKPSNVILREFDGLPILIDFSIVTAGQRDEDESKALTKTGLSLGTAPYMAPEQCEGRLEKPLRVDSRTDVYGLGALLYHTLLGVPPWNKETAWERLTRNPWDNPYPGQSETRARVLQSQNSIDKRLAKVVRRCLQGQPKQRYQSASHLIKALLKCQGQSGDVLWWKTSYFKVSAAIFGVTLIVLAVYFFILFDPMQKISPNPLQNDQSTALKDSPMNKLLIATFAPLITIAAGSEAEAQFYEKTIETHCSTCKKVYDKEVDVCPDDKTRTKAVIVQTVKDVEDYFPIVSGASWKYKMGFSTHSKNNRKEDKAFKDSLNALSEWLGDLNVVINGTTTVNSESFFEMEGSHGTIKTRSYLRQTKLGVMVLTKKKERKCLVPFPLKRGQTWAWNENSVPLLDSIFDGAPARMMGFSVIEWQKLKTPCLTIEIDQTKRKGGVYRLYFAKNIGLVKTVHYDKGVGSRVTELKNWVDIAPLNAKVIEEKKELALKWMLACIKGEAEYLVENATEQLFAGSYRANSNPRIISSHEALSSEELKQRCEKNADLRGSVFGESLFAAAARVQRVEFLNPVQLKKLSGKTQLFEKYKKGLYRATANIAKFQEGIEIYINVGGKVVGVLEREANGKALEILKFVTIEAVESYFPLKEGLRWEYSLMSRPAGKLEFAKIEKKAAIEVVESSIAGKRESFTVKDSQRSWHLEQRLTGLIKLNKRGDSQILIPYPLALNQKWSWQIGLPLPLPISMTKAIATVSGFSKIKVRGKIRRCLTIRITERSNSKVHADLYFLRDVGLIKCVSHSPSGTTWRASLSNLSDFFALQEDIGAKNIRKIASQWKRSFFTRKPDEFQSLTQYPLFTAAVSRSRFVKDGTLSSKGGHVVFESHQDLMERVMRKMMARSRNKRRWERTSQLELFHLERLTVKTVKERASFLRATLMGKSGPIYVLTFGNPKKVDGLQLFVTPEGKVTGMIDFD